MSLGTQLVYGPTLNRKSVPVSSEYPLPVRIAGEEETQFGEILVAGRTPIIELNAVYGLSDIRDITVTSNTATVTSASPEYLLSTGATANSKAELYSAERGRYIPGYGAEAGVGVRVPTAPTGNQYGEWGLLAPSGDDGYVFGIDSDGMYVRLYRGGSISQTVRQADWNVDRLDGTGPSGVEIDAADGQVYQIQFTFYGYGEIRFGVLAVESNRQRFVACHSMRVRGSVSVDEPNLPVSVIAENGATASDFDIYVGGRQYSIIGDYVPKFRTVGQERFGVSSSTTVIPLVTFRNKSGFENRSVKLDSVFVNVTTEDIMIEVYLNSSLTGASYATPTNATAAETGLEVDTSATAMSGGVLIFNQPALAGKGQEAKSLSQAVGVDIPENQPITLAARTITGTGTVDAYMRLIEEW